jgi:hypothetical protein
MAGIVFADVRDDRTFCGSCMVSSSLLRLSVQNKLGIHSETRASRIIKRVVLNERKASDNAGFIKKLFHKSGIRGSIEVVSGPWRAFPRLDGLQFGFWTCKPNALSRTLPVHSRERADLVIELKSWRCPRFFSCNRILSPLC